MANYATPPLLIVRGEGARVWDDAGRDYIDGIGGIAVNALGHGHPALVEAVARQLGMLGHTSNLVATEPVIELAERLIALSGGDDRSRVFFCNSGAEANEAAFKLARLTGRTRMIVASGGFHGRTMGALALTAQPAKQDPFRPLPGEVTVVPFGDADALRQAVEDPVAGPVAAIVLEPIQGEGGVIVPPQGFLIEARAIATAAGALLVLDEVQSGIGRTGRWLAQQHDGVRGDVVTLAKGLAGGLPIGAVIAHGTAASLFQPGAHGSTFGGNPVSAAAALAVLASIEHEGLLERARALGERFASALVERGSGLVSGTRGRGLLLAAVLKGVPAADVELACREHGLLVNAVAGDAIRLAPPLVLSDAEAVDLLDRWEAATAAVARRAA